MSFVDPQIAKDQFDEIPASMLGELRAALKSDLRDLANHFVEASLNSDPRSAANASHALKGICGTFGALELARLLEEPPVDAHMAMVVLECTERTITTLLSLSQCSEPELPILQ